MKSKLNWFNPTRIAIVLCVATMFVYWMSYMGIHNIEYPFKYDVSSYDPYVQQFDAFKKGQLHIDWEADERLIALDNPYNPSERKGINYLWDRAFYDGKYYSYFGVAPIVTIIAPFYFISGIIPAPLLIQFIYIGIFSVVFPKLLMMLFDRYGQKVSSVYKVGLTYVTYLSSFNLLYGRGKNPFYYIACTAAIAFLTLFAYLFFKGIFSENHKKRCVYFLIAGLMYAFCVHSRINTAFTATFFIVPIVIFKMILGAKAWKEKLIELGCLGFFVSIGFLLAFMYNYARFDNPLEFGTTYQITVADVSEYKLDTSEFDDAMDYYFESKPIKDDETGKVTFEIQDKKTVDRYLYIADYFGLYSVPFLMLSLMAIIMCIDRRLSVAYRVTLCSTLIGCFVMAWINFCLGGVIYRYLADFSTEVAVCAALGVLFLLELSYMFENKTVKYMLRVFIVIVMLVSIYKIMRIMAIDSIYMFDIRENTLVARLLNVKNS